MTNTLASGYASRQGNEGRKGSHAGRNEVSKGEILRISASRHGCEGLQRIKVRAGTMAKNSQNEREKKITRRRAGQTKKRAIAMKKSSNCLDGYE